jgi:hypothetical protein
LSIVFRRGANYQVIVAAGEWGDFMATPPNLRRKTIVGLSVGRQWVHKKFVNIRQGNYG